MSNESTVQAQSDIDLEKELKKDVSQLWADHKADIKDVAKTAVGTFLGLSIFF